MLFCMWKNAVSNLVLAKRVCIIYFAKPLI